MNAPHLSQLPAEQIVARVGLVSDTHMPERCLAFPESIFEVLRGVDLLLHAGDVGELETLDRLSAIAPLVAVHGNDDTRAAQRELPYQQLVSIGGRRLLLWHSHYPDPAEDWANRGSSWQRLLARQAERGRRAGATAVIFGHTHVPMAYQYEDVLLVNPGALASGSLFARQTCQTVALLSFHKDGAFSVTHVDLANPDQVYVPKIDWRAGVNVAVSQFQTSIVEPDVFEDIGELGKHTFDDLEALKGAILPLCYPCWAGEKAYVTRTELLNQIEHDTGIASTDREKVIAALAKRAS